MKTLKSVLSQYSTIIYYDEYRNNGILWRHNNVYNHMIENEFGEVILLSDSEDSKLILNKCLHYSVKDAGFNHDRITLTDDSNHRLILVCKRN